MTTTWYVQLCLKRILYRIEQFQKIPNTIPWMAFRNSKGKEGFFELEIRWHEGYLRLEFRRHGGVQDLEFPQRTYKRTDKSFYLMDFYYNQFENKARTDEDADTHRSRIQDKHPSIWHVFICRRKLTKCMWSVHHTPEALTLQNILFSVIKTAWQNILVHSMKKHVFSI